MESLENRGEFIMPEIITPEPEIIMPDSRYCFGSIGTSEKIDQIEARNTADIVNKYRVKVPIERGVGCMDGRIALQMLNGEAAEIRQASGGGLAITAVIAYELNGSFRRSGHILKDFANTFAETEKNNLPTIFHTDSTHAEPLFNALVSSRALYNKSDSFSEMVEKIINADSKDIATACAMNDSLPAIVSNLSYTPIERKYSNGETRYETEAEVQGRLKAIADAAKAVDPNFDESLYQEHYFYATELLRSGYLKGWNSFKALQIADAYLLLQNVKDGALGRIEVLHDDGLGVHGHSEEEASIEKEEDVALDSKQLFEEQGKKVFRINAGVWNNIADLDLAKNRPESVKQAALAAHFAAYVVLIKDGSVPVVV